MSKEDIYKRSYDRKCKEIISYKSILSKILKYTLDEYKDIDLKEIIPLIGSNDSEKVIGIQNAFPSHEYDLFFSSRLPNSTNVMDLFIDIEPQKTRDVGYYLHNRGIFYVGNEIAYQYKRAFKDSKYDDLKKSVSIFISFDAPSKEEENSMTVLHLSKNMKIGYNRLVEKDYDKIQVIVIYLGQDDCDDPFLNFLRLVFRSDISFEDKMKRLSIEHDVYVSDSLKQEVHEMYGISDLIEKRGIEIGIERGIERGIEQGIEQGKLEFAIEQLQKRMNKKNLSLKEAMIDLDYDMKDYDLYKDKLALLD